MNRNEAGRKARSRVLRLLVLALATWANQADAETFVILSMVGDHLTIVTQRRQTGSHIDVNGYQTFENSDPVLDEFAAKAADAIIAKTRADAASVTIRADPAWYKIRDSWVDAELIRIPELIADIKRRLPPITDAHLLLITPYRDQPKLRTQEAELGSGKVSGLGFYVDTETTLYRSDTHEKSLGYLGIFSNFQLVLIDLGSGAVEGHERVVLGTTRSSARAADRTLWNALTTAQKTQVLESLMKAGIDESLPKMLAATKK
jgi:hypothetical protein